MKKEALMQDVADTILHMVTPGKWAYEVIEAVEKTIDAWRPSLFHDPRSDTPDVGVSYVNCGKCLEELPDDVSPAEWARQQVAFTDTGAIQVRCNRHDLNVLTMSFVPPEGLEYPV